MFTYENCTVNYEIIKNKHRERWIFFLHGWGGSTESFRFFAKSLKKNFNCLLVDFPAHGKSEEPQKPYSVEDFGNLIIALAKFLKVKNFDIVSHSFGGRVAIFLGGSYNEYIGKIVLFDAAGIKPKRGISYRLKIAKYKIMKKFFPKKAAKMGSEDYRILSPVMKQSFVKIVNEDLSHLCKNITSETLIIFGKNDVDTPIWMAKKLKKLIKNSALIIYPDSGHFAYAEEPIKSLAILNSFLRSK